MRFQESLGGRSQRLRAGWCMRSEELEIACGDCSLRDLDGKEDERTVALGEAELKNEIFLMKRNLSMFLSLVKGAVLVEEMEEMKKSGDN